jgi:hypothetical protein
MLGDAFADAVQTRQTEYGEQIGATEALNDVWDAFHSQTYMPHVKIARLVFDGQAGTIRRIGVDGIRPDAFDAYLQEARQFYSGLWAQAYGRIPCHRKVRQRFRTGLCSA